MKWRAFERIINGQETSDGAGVRLKRTLGQRPGARLDPFLMLDEFRSDDATDYIAGFPAHPHRGFETVTYMLAGRMRHEDHLGNRGIVEGGGVQWMTAARGIIHAEMPEQESGLMHGFQLWLNLPAKEKMNDPAWRDIPAGDIPSRAINGGLVRVIAGEFDGTIGAVRGASTDPLYLDVRLEAGETFTLDLADARNACVYAFLGEIGNTGADGHPKLNAGQLGLLGRGDGVTLRAGEADAGFLLLAARPLNEPVVQYGPFVMNTREEIEQAMRDYQSGRFGRPAI
ncbi:MAG TPA: pirin family protein [Gammaproteobacteria bacterium]